GAGAGFQLAPTAAPRSAAATAPRPTQADAFGGKSEAEQALFDREREREQRAQQAPEVGAGLFSGRSQQADIADAAPADRRQNLSLRSLIEGMSQDEVERALFTDELTGLGNRRAYQAQPRRKVQVSIDADSLKWVNDHMGHDAGDA